MSAPLADDADTLDDPRAGGTSQSAARSFEPPDVPGYEIVRMLDRGGMGVVWEAIERRLERRVALKVHLERGVSSERTAAMWAEAKLAARIAHPGVVSVHDVGKTLRDEPYYTMDLVEGTTLRAALRDGPLPQTRAVAIAAEIADAIAAAHERGVVHCDLKPANILLDLQGRVRILDFGLAEQLDARRARVSVRGTLPYMAPELLDSEAPTAACDVFAIGVMLYEMLAGVRPFQGDSYDGLLGSILTDDPPPLSRADGAVQTDVEKVCLRCLAKHPENRLQSARALHAALTAILEGRSPDAEAADADSYALRPRPAAAPLALASASEADVRAGVRFTLPAPPEKVWPLLSDSDRILRALGRSPVTVKGHRTEEGSWRMTESTREFGITRSWEKAPFEWIHLREVLGARRYHGGVLGVLWFKIALTATPDGGTECDATVGAKGKGLLGRLAAAAVTRRFAVGFTGYCHEVARKLAADATAHHRARPRRPSAAQSERVLQAAARLVDERRFPAELVARLSGMLLESPDEEVVRLRPFVLADAWGKGRAEVLDLFLHAAHAGLLDVSWDLMCPACRVKHDNVTSLRHVTGGGECSACGTAYERDLASSVELVFLPHHALRPVRHEIFCASTPALSPHVLVKQLLAPGERRAVEVALPRGDYRVVAAREARVAELSVSAVGLSSTSSFRVSPEAMEARPLVVRAGEVAIELENATSHDEEFRLETTSAKEDRVTAAEALVHPAFREFFSTELFAYGEHVSISRMVFMLVDLDGRDELLAERGDAAALRLFGELEAAVREATEAHQGTLVQGEPVSGALVGAFAAEVLAVRAALDLLAKMGERLTGAPLRASVHHGRCIAFNRGETLHYFGETVARAASLLAECEPGSVAVSATVLEDREVARLLRDAGVERKVAVGAAGMFKGRRLARLRPRATGDASAAEATSPAAELEHIH